MLPYHGKVYGSEGGSHHPGLRAYGREANIAPELGLGQQVGSRQKYERREQEKQH